MQAALLAFGLVFVAELGDKSQLLALAFAARYRFRHVLAGLVLANLATQTLSVTAGGLLGAAIRGPAVSVLAGVLFLVFAAITLQGARRSAAQEDEAAELPPERAAGSIVLAVAGGIFLAEVGDKTMVVTMALAAREGVVPTWFGSVAGMTAAGVVGMLLGRGMRGRVPERVLALGSVALFTVFGIAFLLDAAGMAPWGG